MQIEAMQIDTKLLTLTQWLSPAFPLGSFAYSHGLEQAVRSGWVRSDDDLLEWLRDIARFGSGHADAIWMRLAFAAKDEAEIAILNSQCRAYAPCLERLREAERQGHAFAQTASKTWDIRLPSLQLPIALGWAAHQTQLSIDMLVTLYLQAFLSNLVATAQRLMPLGQNAAQAVVAQLNLICAEIAADTTHKGLEDISSSAFLSDIAAMRHETLQPRIFQS